MSRSILFFFPPVALFGDPTRDVFVFPRIFFFPTITLVNHPFVMSRYVFERSRSSPTRLALRGLALGVREETVSTIFRAFLFLDKSGTRQSGGRGGSRFLPTPTCARAQAALRRHQLQQQHCRETERTFGYSDAIDIDTEENKHNHGQQACKPQK